MAVEVQQFVDVKVSLADLVGTEYVDAVCAARAVLAGEDADALRALCHEPVDCYPAAMQARLSSLLPRVGQPVAVAAGSLARGATSAEFARVTHTAVSPLSGYGYYRVGEDGRLFLISKSEHYHAPLGHAFPGYRLIDRARLLGIPNPTHNNTRGHITRLLEEELVRSVNGIAPGDRAALDAVLDAREPGTVNRVLNLETGSLAVEAALKMMLARFHVPQEGAAEPPYAGRIPVILVLGNDEGGLQANYHGTTLLTQTLRGMWPTFLAELQQHDIVRVCAVRPNNIEELEAAFWQYEQPPYKLAGFFHEIVMMNYGARLISRDYLQRAYALCRRHDVPAAVDEIQSCMWAPNYFMFREYDLRPDFVILGKGFPGGEYPASRVLFSADMDNLPQFGALVTNGQEELASLAYLITMRWATANAEPIRHLGDYYEARMREMAARFPAYVSGAEGNRHMTSLCFHKLDQARAFVAALNTRGLDISVQTYKTEVPPVVLTKLPIILGTDGIDLVIARMGEAFAELG